MGFIMNALNGTKYKSNFERAGVYYISTCAPTEELRGRHLVRDLIISIYQAFVEKSEQMGLKTETDVSFKVWEQQKGREKDVKTIRKSNEKIIEFMDMLFAFVKSADVSEAGLSADIGILQKKSYFIKVLDAAEITYEKDSRILIHMEQNCAQAFKELALLAEEQAVDANGNVNASKAVFYFSRVVFSPKQDWLCENMDRMSGADGSFVWLCKCLEQSGYQREVFVDGRYFSLNYTKEYTKKPQPLKKAWAEKSHLGIEMSYEDICIEPATLWLRIFNYTEVLKKISVIPEPTRTFLLEHTRTCDGCKYCSQLDKTGKRELAAISINGEMKCPYYPAFSLRFTKIDRLLMENVLSVMIEIEKIL